MKIETEKINEFTVFSLFGRIDATNFKEFQAQIMEFARNEVSNIILDLQNLNYISSSGLRVILQIQKEINLKNGTIKFCGLSEPISELFEIAGFSSIFEIYKSKQEATNTK